MSVRAQHCMSSWVGKSEGTTEGTKLGSIDGTVLGSSLGDTDGSRLGATEGASVGAAEGTPVDSMSSGAKLGDAVGTPLGKRLGTLVGLLVGPTDGTMLGAMLGITEGAPVQGSGTNLGQDGPARQMFPHTSHKKKPGLQDPSPLAGGLAQSIDSGTQRPLAQHLRPVLHQLLLHT
jgi:hypothetical protein